MRGHVPIPLDSPDYGRAVDTPGPITQATEALSVRWGALSRLTQVWSTWQATTRAIQVYVKQDLSPTSNLDEPSAA